MIRKPRRRSLPTKLFQEYGTVHAFALRGPCCEPAPAQGRRAKPGSKDLLDKVIPFEAREGHGAGSV